MSRQQPMGGDPRREGGLDCWAALDDEGTLDIARTLGVGEIWSDEYDESGYPTKEHGIWGVLQRRLDRKAVGDSVGDVYLVLDQLRLPRRVASTPTYQDPTSLELVTLSGSNRVYALEVLPHDDPRLFAFIDRALEGQAYDVALCRFLGSYPAAARVEASGSTTSARVALCVERFGDLSRELTSFARSPTSHREVDDREVRLQDDSDGQWSQRVLTVLRDEQPAVENDRTGVPLELTDDGFHFLASLTMLALLRNVPVRLARLRHYPLAEMPCSSDGKTTCLLKGRPIATAVRTWLYRRMDSPYGAVVSLDRTTSVLCPYLERLEPTYSIHNTQSKVEDGAEVERGHSMRPSLWRSVRYAELQSIRGSDQKCIVVDAASGDSRRLVIHLMFARQNAPAADAQALTGRAIRVLQLALEPVPVNPLQVCRGNESALEKSRIWHLGLLNPSDNQGNERRHSPRCPGNGRRVPPPCAYRSVNGKLRSGAETSAAVESNPPCVA